MAVQLSVAVRNARLNAIETTVGATAVLKLRTGAQPANCAAADSGTVVATMTLPADWMNDAGSGAKTILGTWEDTSADSGAVPAHFRIYESTATTCHLQGTVGEGSGDLSLDNTDINAGQDVAITLFTLNDGNS